jgi:hypothetical protein
MNSTGGIMNEVKDPAGTIAYNPADGRYNLVALAKDWLAVLKRSDEAKSMGQSELVKKALEDIVSGRVTKEDVMRAVVKMKTQKSPDSEAKETKEVKA